MKKINLKRSILLLLLFVIFSFGSNRLYAQWTVIDPSNLIENILSVLEEVEANINLVNQIENQLKSLQRLGSSSFSAIQDILNNNTNDLEDLIAAVKGIGYLIDSINSEYDAIFPDNDGWDAEKLSNYPAYARDWNNKTTSSIKDAMKAQSVLSRIKDTNNNVISILSEVSGADGEVRQLQAMNQILSQMSSQLSDIAQTMAVTSRMTATALAAEESHKAASRQIIDNSLATFGEKDATKPAYGTLPKLED